MKKFIIIIGSIIIVCFILFYWIKTKNAPYDALASADYEIKNTKFPFLCPNTNNGIWWTGGYVDPNNLLIYYQYVIKYDKNTNKLVLNNLKNNPDDFYRSICTMKQTRYLIDNTNGIIANYRTDDNPEIMSLHATKDICKKF